jgi:hypothetical protein
MTEHLPECAMQTKDSICRCLPCICDALRACEARVTALATPETVVQANLWWEEGQRDAIAAAVNRVEALFLARLLHSNGFVNAIIAAIKGDQP